MVSAVQELLGSQGRKDINTNNQAIKTAGQKQFPKDLKAPFIHSFIHQYLLSLPCANSQKQGLICLSLGKSTVYQGR